jgi:hypothetical protein
MADRPVSVEEVETQDARAVLTGRIAARISDWFECPDFSANLYAEQIVEIIDSVATLRMPQLGSVDAPSNQAPLSESQSHETDPRRS